MITFRPYQPQLDEPAVLKLWQQTLGHTWPISQDIFHFLTVGHPAYQPSDHLVALAHNSIIGFSASQIQPTNPSHGSLLVLLVAPTYQRQGIGRQLHHLTLTNLKAHHVQHLHLASGTLFNFWPGVPLNLPTAWSFFHANGWTEHERTFDLTLNLHQYTTPPWIYNRLHNSNISITTATTSDIPAILAFETQHFPHWLSYYQNLLTPHTIHNIVIAKDSHNTIHGTSFLRLPPHMGGTTDIPWLPTLGPNTGGIGPLGVSPSMRGRGIGLALAAKVTELLHTRGITTSYIGYTWLTNWYAHLGYSIWAEYRLCTRPL